MKEDLKEKLRKKGWSEADIDKAEGIMADAAEKTKTKKIDLFVYWTALIISIILNIVVSGIIIPMMFLIHGLALIGLVFIISLFFGWVFYILIKDIENMEIHHHIIAGLFIPAIALINIFMIVNIGNRLISNLPPLMEVPKAGPFQISIVYAIGFTIPYLISQLRKKG
ncbi:hypothetical protein KY345_02085 [Candidatus Woesearchaeota archaeon]|nr:hypothetical protein [Candidatus Woesearchaeota archaeon]